MQTLVEINEGQYQNLLRGGDLAILTAIAEPPAEGTDENAFLLEKHLEDFIVNNFEMIFKGKLQIYEGTDVADGQQYATDIGPIDILAIEPESGSFVVIELKKGRPSDQVVGQILRYMGWVKRKLCKDGQAVKGLVICPARDPDQKLTYALEMTSNIKVQYYSVSFSLRETP
jgi:restriction system protein